MEDLMAYLRVIESAEADGLSFESSELSDTDSDDIVNSAPELLPAPEQQVPQSQV